MLSFTSRIMHTIGSASRSNGGAVGDEACVCVCVCACVCVCVRVCVCV